MQFDLAITTLLSVCLLQVRTSEIQCYLCDSVEGGPCDTPLDTNSAEVTTVPCNTTYHQSACAFTRQELPDNKIIIKRSCLGYCEQTKETCCTTDLCNSGTRPALRILTSALPVGLVLIVMCFI